jgi:uncharacterized protein DUF4190
VHVDELSAHHASVRIGPGNSEWPDGYARLVAMSTSGPGDDSRGSSWDNPSWSSSLSDSSLSRPDEQPPNPWSREGSSGGDPATPGPASTPSATPPPDPYQPPAADPYANPGGYAGPFPTSAPSAAEPPQVERPDPGYDPQPTPQYGNGAAPYGNPPPAYGDPAPVYGAPPPAYGSNPYEVAGYPAYGTSSPYGVVPVSHPQSTTALIFGILGIVFGFSCGIGGLLGIGGIIQGRKARNEIDAQPGRYTGRSQAVAGIVTGVIGLVIAAIVIVAIIAVIVSGAASGEF